MPTVWKWSEKKMFTICALVVNWYTFHVYLYMTTCTVLSCAAIVDEEAEAMTQRSAAGYFSLYPCLQFLVDCVTAPLDSLTHSLTHSLIHSVTD